MTTTTLPHEWATDATPYLLRIEKEKEIYREGSHKFSSLIVRCEHDERGALLLPHVV